VDPWRVNAHNCGVETGAENQWSQIRILTRSRLQIRILNEVISRIRIRNTALNWGKHTGICCMPEVLGRETPGKEDSQKKMKVNGDLFKSCGPLEGRGRSQLRQGGSKSATLPSTEENRRECVACLKS
jgi:hypothetical protein